VRQVVAPTPGHKYWITWGDASVAFCQSGCLFFMAPRGNDVLWMPV